MTDLQALPVVSVTPVGARQALVVLDVDHSPVRSSHTIPGQYVKAALWRDDVPRPYAIASRPGSATLELLVKLPSGDAPAEERRATLVSMLPGEKLRVSRAEGRGYPLDTLRGHDVIVVGVGTGIAPLRSLIETMLLERTAFGELTLLYGVQRPDDLAFRARFGAWAGLSLRVVPVVSRPGDSGWTGAVGYVQDHLPKALAHPSRTHAVVCGLPEMDRVVSARLLELGVGPERVHRNW
jgi:NAD(P)H-flavin reductase